VTEDVRKMGASAPLAIARAAVSASSTLRTSHGFLRTPGLRRMEASDCGAGARGLGGVGGWGWWVGVLQRGRVWVPPPRLVPSPTEPGLRDGP
jgi:hypothetical protein